MGEATCLKEVAGKNLFGVGFRGNRRREGSGGQEVQITHWRNFAKDRSRGTATGGEYGAKRRVLCFFFSNE